jgi:hypothetical protein
MSTHRSFATFIVLLAGAGACASGPKLPLFGTWRIQLPPGTAPPAQTSVQNLAWVGVSASFQPDDARVGASRCYQPTYTPQTLSAGEFQQAYSASPSSLGLQGDPITVYKLTCAHEWQGQADTVIVKSDTVLLTRWNGMFFELIKTAPALTQK